MLKPTAWVDFAEDLFFLDFPDEAPIDCNVPTNPNPSRRSPEHFFQEILDDAVDRLPGLAAQEGKQNENEEEEEELEWLANKDAFPALETSFDLSVHSWSSSSAASAASAASADHRSPVSVLASALPFRAPARSRSKGQRRRRKALLFFAPPLPAAAAPPPSTAAGKRKCRHCESEETPQWRAGPDGPKTLCNACGVRFKSGRLVPEYRPANSPTFSAAVHSNSHRRVVEIRRKKYGTDSAAASTHRRGRRSFCAELAVM